MQHLHWFHVFLTKVNGPLQYLGVQLLHPVAYQSTAQLITVKVDKGWKLSEWICLNM